MVVVSWCGEVLRICVLVIRYLFVLCMFWKVLLKMMKNIIIMVSVIFDVMFRFSVIMKIEFSIMCGIELVIWM